MFILPFAIGLVLAYLIRPVAQWLENHLPPKNKWQGFRRILSVFICFLMLLILIGGFLYIVTTAFIDASLTLVDRAPQFFGSSFYQIQLWFENIIDKLPLEIQQSIGDEVSNAGFNIGNAVKDFLLNSMPSLPGTLNFVLGFAVLPFFMFYLLKDREYIARKVTTVFPENINRHVQAVFSIIENVAGRYIRSQLMLGLIVGYFTFVGLLLLGIPSQYVLALALLAGVTELIPTLGPWIGGSVAAIVTLSTSPEKTIWVVLLFVVIQALENNLLVPKIQSAYLGIHPAVMIVLLVFGLYIAGFWGILLIGPLTAVLLQIGKYVRDCMKEPNLELATAE